MTEKFKKKIIEWCEKRSGYKHLWVNGKLTYKIGSDHWGVLVDKETIIVRISRSNEIFFENYGGVEFFWRQEKNINFEFSSIFPKDELELEIESCYE
jgi:hypothetical protein